MVIEVRIFGQVAPQLPHNQELVVPDNTCVEDVARILDLKTDLIGLMTINGKQCEGEEPVVDGCHLCFFPYMSGG
jgi:molybdopterin converting factor small subunit